MRFLLFSYFFFFQAEDGIRDVAVTGVQTCALPISGVVDSGLAVLTLRCRIPPSSLIARSAMSGGSALPCQPSLFSISGKPLPLMVLAKTTVGLPVAERAVP